MELLQILVGAFLLILTVTALLTALIGFFPRFTGQVERAVLRTPGRTLVVGLINLFFLGTITLTLGALGQNVSQIFFLLAFIFLALLAAGFLFCLLGLVQLLGRRLWPEREAFAQTSRAAALITLAALTPFVGWFGFLPVLLTAALGGSVMVLVGRFQAGREPVDRADPETISPD